MWTDNDCFMNNKTSKNADFYQRDLMNYQLFYTPDYYKSYFVCSQVDAHFTAPWEPTTFVCFDKF